MSLLCWRLPKNDQEIVNIVENTSLIIVLRRDFEAEKVRMKNVFPAPLPKGILRATCVVTHPQPYTMFTNIQFVEYFR